MWGVAWMTMKGLWMALMAGFVRSMSVKRQEACNGHVELCDRSYGNVTFIGAHDSYAFSSNPFALARDQSVNISSQLALGVRLLQAQAHMKNGDVHFCHTSCTLFDGGTMKDYLSTVKAFLDSHPNEVVTLLFTNPESLSMTSAFLPAFNSSGISSYAYVPPSLPMSHSSWPTLGSMISSGKRLVTFIDFGADKGGDTVPFLLPEFQHIWETPYDSTNASFPCSINRTAGPLSNEEHMYMINHFLDFDLFEGILIPDELSASKTNSVDSILSDAAGCTHLASNRNPSFVLLDWVDQGQGFLAGDHLNGLSQPQNTTSSATPVSSPRPASSGSSIVLKVQSKMWGVILGLVVVPLVLL